MIRRNSGAPPSPPLLDLTTLNDAAAEVARIAKRQHVRVAMIGGMAMHMFGSPRLTGDVDVVADGPPPRSMPVERQLTFGGVAVRTSGGVPVDWVLRDDDFAPLYDAALNKAPRVPGFPLRVVEPEYIAAMKMAAGRGKDILDLEFLIADEAIDVVATRKIVKRFLGPYAAKEFDVMVKEVEWRKRERLI